MVKISPPISAQEPLHASASHPGPRSLAELFWAFTVLALQGFGGVVAIVQRELVDKRQWLTPAQFVEDWAVAQVLPGPNVVNISLMIGDRYFGVRGGMVALAGMLSFPLVIVLILAALFSGVSDSVAVQGALRGMGAVAAGMIVATGLRLLVALKGNVLGSAVCLGVAVATFVAIALLRLPLIWVLLVLGGSGGLWAYRQLGRIEKAAP
ncbi:MAG: chromate transporter [Rhodoferax sp.]|jgi:chromate transporter|uniref:chromate transporter n=1 Tax=Rhodoferax sp. TaxID=50421 RepID=UPI003BB2226F